MSCDCFGQSAKTIKNSATSCFVCRGDLSGVPRLLAMGNLYPACSPLVEGETKNSPLQPMTTPDECIVAFVGNCAIDATEWTEDAKAPVYDDVDVIKQCVSWPEDEEGNSVFTEDEIELIAQGHTCCIRFHDMQDCATAPEWVLNQQ